MCPAGVKRIAGFRSRACICEILEPLFHCAFIWYLIGEEDSCSGYELSSPIICQMKSLMTQPGSVSDNPLPAGSIPGRKVSVFHMFAFVSFSVWRANS